MRALREWAIMSPPDQPYLERQKAFAGSPQRPNSAAESWMKGYLFEAGKIGKSIEAFDAMTAALDLAVPYVLIQGREDRLTPTPVAKSYFDQVRSIGKTFASIEGGTSRVLPTARSSSPPCVAR